MSPTQDPRPSAPAPPRLTLEVLKERLEWPNIVLHRGATKREGAWFEVLPSNPDRPTLQLHFDDEILWVDSIYISRTHWHYDSAAEGDEGERRNVDRAVRDLNDLVHGRMILYEMLDRDQEYLGGQALFVERKPRLFSSNARWIRTVRFDREPILEPIGKAARRKQRSADGDDDPEFLISLQSSWPASPCLCLTRDEWMQENCASGHEDGSLRIWMTVEDDRAAEPIRLLQAHQEAATSVHWGPEDYVVSGARDGSVALWRAGWGRRLHIFEPHRAPIERVGWADDHWRFASRSSDGEVRIWNAETRNLLEIFHSGSDRRRDDRIRRTFFDRRDPQPDQTFSQGVAGTWEAQGLWRFEIGERDRLLGVSDAKK